MHEYNLHAGWIQVKHQYGLYFWNESNMLKTHSMHEHNLHTGWIQVKHWNQKNMLKLIVHVQSIHKHNLHADWIQVNMVCIFGNLWK